MLRAGATLLLFADLIARLALAPAELPIGIVTAFLAACFFGVSSRLAYVGEIRSRETNLML